MQTSIIVIIELTYRLITFERQPDYASLNKRPIKLKLRSLEEEDGPRVDRLQYREELPRHRPAELLATTMTCQSRDIKSWTVPG